MVSMGVYCMEPDVLDHIPEGVPFGFDDLILCMLGRRLPVGTFLHSGLWLDVGRVEDFQKAQDLAWDEGCPAFDELSLDSLSDAMPGTPAELETPMPA